MATQVDVSRVALALPEVREEADRFACSPLHRGRKRSIAWVWMERIAPKRARVPNPEVIAVRVASLVEKDAVLALDPRPRGSTRPAR